MSATAIEGLPNPAASFVFCYRSLGEYAASKSAVGFESLTSSDALKSMRIIPRTPTPALLEERDFATLSQDDLKELHKQLREMKVCMTFALPHVAGKRNR